MLSVVVLSIGFMIAAELRTDVVGRVRSGRKNAHRFGANPKKATRHLLSFHRENDGKSETEVIEEYSPKMRDAMDEARKKSDDELMQEIHNDAKHQTTGTIKLAFRVFRELRHGKLPPKIAYDIIRDEPERLKHMSLLTVLCERKGVQGLHGLLLPVGFGCKKLDRFMDMFADAIRRKNPEDQIEQSHHLLGKKRARDDDDESGQHHDLPIKRGKLRHYRKKTKREVHVAGTTNQQIRNERDTDKVSGNGIITVRE